MKFEISVTFIKQNTPNYNLQLKKDLANKYENITEKGGEYGIEECTYYSSDLDYETPRKNIIKG